MFNDCDFWKGVNIHKKQGFTKKITGMEISINAVHEKQREKWNVHNNRKIKNKMKKHLKYQ